MTDENQNNDDLQPEQDQQWSEAGELEAIGPESGESGTIMDIEPTVPDLRADAEPDEIALSVEPEHTMFAPTTPGAVSGGSVEETMAGATGSSGRAPMTPAASAPSSPPPPPAPQAPTGGPSGPPVPASGAGLMSGGSGGMPIAPFGGKIVVGTRISQIEVTGVLGKGGMGEVFRGFHHALDIDVAIKVLPDELSRNDLVRQRFLREARLCVKLDHPNIVRVYNVDEYAGNLFLVMEMIDGSDAAHMLKDGGRLAYKRALEIGEASAKALTCAHQQGLVHRDIKPHNILLGSKDGKIKISDFGLARAATSSSHLTMSGQIMGTPHYMSPEQAESKEVTDKSDVYSLGITIYHMLTGETPFTGDTPISVAVQHIAKEVLYPESRFRAFPSELVAVLKRMTAKDPTKRCSAKQAAVWLRKLIDMAPDEDIAQQPEVMQTMAPVVRESRAFEVAREQREQQNERAREMARTMQATMQEAEARQPSAQMPVLSESTAASHQAVDAQPHKSGKGGMIAATIAFLALAGGGVAAWKMGYLGINENTDNTEIISVKPPVNNETPEANTETGPDSNSPDANSNTQPDNGNGSETGPGPGVELEDEAITKQLTDANSIVTSATTLVELEKAKNTLASIKIEYGRLSEGQRTEYDRIRTRFDQRLALYTARELNDQVQVGVAKATGIWPTDLNAGISALNRAIDAKNKLDAMALPTEVEQALKDERKTQADAVAAALQVAREVVFDDAIKLAKAGNYDEADSRMASYERIHLSDEVALEVAGLRASFQVRALILRADAQLDLNGFAKAGKAIDEADAKATTEDLRGEVKQARGRVTAAVAGAFDKHMSAVDTAVSANEFETARNEIDRAQELPLLSTDQLVQLATRTFMVNVSSHIAKVESAIDVDAFNEAAESLAAADKEIADGANKTLPADTTTRLETVRSLFASKLQSRFASLLETARANLTDSKFAEAAANVGAAAKLPLNETQRSTLDKFRDQNKQALESYVASLIADIEKALDANDFEGARLKLEEEKSLPVPDDLKLKLEELRARFATAALTRYADLLASANSALENKRYEAARKALDELVSIPVDDEHREKATALDKQYWDDLTADVTAYLAAVDKKLEDEDFESAKTELDAAEALPLSAELERKVKLKRTKWEEELETTFAAKLANAIKSCSNKLFKTGGKMLKEAEKLPLTQAQLLRLSDAQDAHKKALNAHIDTLFKQLEKYIATGKEREGKIIANKLDRLVISLTHQMKLKRLRNALTGESSSNRLKRLPDRLRNWYGDSVCSSEQLMSLGEEVSALYVSPDGKFAAAGTESGKVTFFNLKRGTKLGTSRGGRRKITAIAISPDGKMAVCGNDDGDLVSFTLSGSSIQTKAMGSLDDDTSAITYGTGKNSLWVLTDEGEINRYNPKTGAKVSTSTSGIYTASAISVSPDNKYIAVGGEDAEIALFSVDRMVFKKKLQGPGDDAIQRISFSADSRKLVAGSESDGVAVWDVRKLTKDPIMKFEGLPQRVQGVGFSADGSRIIALDDEYQIRVFDIKTGKKIKTIKYEDFKSEDLDVMVTSGFVSSDGTIVLGTQEGEIYHFTVKNAK